LLQDTVTVAGAAATVITNTTAPGAFFPLCRSNALATVFAVADAVAGPDLLVHATLANAGFQADPSAMTKTGAGHHVAGRGEHVHGSDDGRGGHAGAGRGRFPRLATAITVSAGATLDVVEKAGFTLGAGPGAAG
jgi:hypothetical protein